MICAECKTDKDTQEFHRDNSRPRGRVARCKSCYSNRQKLDRHRAPKRFSEHKSNAVKRGIQWELTFDEYLAWLWDAPCYFCGRDTNGGIDRMNNESFYSIQNTLACCGRCNAMKSKDTLHVFLGRIAQIAENLGLTANAAIACHGE